jgi:arylsulfatase A-like enzyme
MISGMYQTTIGAHHHRSSYPGSEVYLPEQIKPLPAYFKQHGYYTANGGPKKTTYRGDTESQKKRLGKTDYNFVWDPDIYDGNDWTGRRPGQPFFAQIQLRGGKYRDAEIPNPVDPAKVRLPPYYPDHPVIRQDWARYLNSVIYADIQVGRILERLKSEGIAENTIVILYADHGMGHARGKQFLYDEGIHIPLIMRSPGVIKPGTVRDDMVSQIDIAATSLYMAGIPLPEYMEARPLFGPDYRPRQYVVAARDRCDETLDCIRCVRTKRYKYIRNFFPFRAHLQPNRHKDRKEIVKTMRRLFAEGGLNELQARLFAPVRPVEELYDLESDPHEIHNLADSPEHRDTLKRLRLKLLVWMEETKDLGLVPEPELEQLAKKYSSRYDIFRRKENAGLLKSILRVVNLDIRGETAAPSLTTMMSDDRSEVRWWAAMELGNLGAKARSAEAVLAGALSDSSAGVKVAAARALCKMDAEEKGLPALMQALSNKDQVVRHYAALALEDIGEKARPALGTLRRARGDKYEYVRRVADRLVSVLEDTGSVR